MRDFYRDVICCIVILYLITIYVNPASAVTVVDKESIQPEQTIAIVERDAVVGSKIMAATAHPQASEAAIAVLCDGGSAIDAIIAAQMVLNVVEPVSSGIGGGAFLLYYDKAQNKVYAYDGRETAPAQVPTDLFVDDANNPMPFFQALVGGRSVGVPGVLHMLDKAYKAHGKAPWSSLFVPAIQSAREGTVVTPRLHGLLATAPHLQYFPDTVALFFDDSGAATAIGTKIRNPALADTLTIIAKKGIIPFYDGSIARDIVKAVNAAPQSQGSLSLSDMRTYRSIEREPLFLDYKGYTVCGMPPPSSGGIAVLQTLGMLQHHNLAQWQYGSPEQILMTTEAEKLAYADRDAYVADPQFAAVPTQQLLDPQYLKERAKQISLHRAIPKASPGDVVTTIDSDVVPINPEFPCTTHLCIVDSKGNVASMTSSIEYMFGSGILVRGFLLNNQLTDFSFVTTKDGRPIANRVEPNKRPRSSMAPTLVFDKATGDPVLAVGSPGGARIINYVNKVLVAVLEYGMGVQEAINAPNYSNRNGPLELEHNTVLENYVPFFKERGLNVLVTDLNSGLQAIQINREKTTSGYRPRLASRTVLIGGADPRRDGAAVSDCPTEPTE